MKGLIIFNSLNDIAFLWADNQFKSHINEVAFTAGLLEKNDHGQDISPDVAMQLFSPIISSQRFMTTQVKNPYSSITCENGCIFVFKQYHGHIYLAINGDKEEDEAFLQKKLLVFQRIIHFHFGPILRELQPNNYETRLERWETLGSLLKTWCFLLQQEQSFLVEAIERLHVNQSLSKSCIELLESSLVKLRAAGDRHALHSFLLVNSKLLALYSGRNAFELLPSDILLIILVTRQIFRHDSKIEDLMSFNKSRNAGDYFRSMKDDFSDSDDQYFSVDTDDELNNSSNSSSDTLEKQRELFFTPDGQTESTPSFPTSEFSAGKEGLDGLLQMTVFLHTPAGLYSPHILYCLEISPGVILVMISEIVRSRQSGNMCQVIDLVKALLAEDVENMNYGRFTYEIIENNIRRILDACKKMKGSVESIGSDIRKKWDDVKNKGLLEWLELTKKTLLNSRLENSLSRLDDSVKNLFRRLYILPKQLQDDVQMRVTVALTNLKQDVANKLADYSGYLAVKAQRNITMTSYLEDFPGLVHFIYVDRTHEMLTAPSINITSQSVKGKTDATRFIKKKIWSMVKWGKEKLQQGHVAMSKREGDFVFSYFLWFEDSSGNPLQIQHPYKASNKTGPPGIIAGNFYRKMIRQCFSSMSQRSVHGYEIYVMHLGIVPTDLVLTHCRQLSGVLWESCGDMDSTFSLL